MSDRDYLLVNHLAEPATAHCHFYTVIRSLTYRLKHHQVVGRLISNNTSVLCFDSNYRI